ncbi:ATP-binding cassette domain-containing protein [Frigoribacterium sp. 2-23]|uniref:ATP-binding cassette domain-containing protein n=1 Tax=Frigoribacterium sp. 2-23 TaxID=3415006 RepID=UPI003C6EDF03
MTTSTTVTDLEITLAGRALLQGVDLSIAAGERVALMGASGSGKTLLTAALLGTLPPSAVVSGRIEIAGTGDPRQRDAVVAGVQQDSSTALNPLVRVGAHVARPFRAAGSSRLAARREAATVLAALDLDADRVLDAWPAELSGGQRQRVCIAVALACRADLVIADEPTTALDVVSQARVVEAIATACDRTGAGLLFVTHDRDVAEQLCTRAVVLDAGRVVDRFVFSSTERPLAPHATESTAA